MESGTPGGDLPRLPGAKGTGKSRQASPVALGGTPRLTLSCVAAGCLGCLGAVVLPETMGVAGCSLFVQGEGRLKRKGVGGRVGWGLVEERKVLVAGCLGRALLGFLAYRGRRRRQGVGGAQPRLETLSWMLLRAAPLQKNYLCTSYAIAGCRPAPTQAFQAGLAE